MQKVNEPAMMPFAIAVGNRTYANLVKGNCRAANITGGMTNLSLASIRVNDDAPDINEYRKTHRSIGK